MTLAIESEPAPVPGGGRTDQPFLLPARGEREVTVPMRGSGLARWSTSWPRRPPR